MSLATPTAEDRIFYGAIALALVAAVAAGGWRGAAAAGGVLVGAVFSILNYVWLRSGANALLAAAAGQQMTRPMARGAVMFLVRFALLGLCVYAILISRLVPLPPVLGGLFVVPAAALMEGLRQLTAPQASE